MFVKFIFSFDFFSLFLKFSFFSSSKARVMQKLWGSTQFEICSVQALLYLEKILSKYRITLF